MTSPVVLDSVRECSHLIPNNSDKGFGENLLVLNDSANNADTFPGDYFSNDEAPSTDTVICSDNTENVIPKDRGFTQDRLSDVSPFGKLGLEENVIPQDRGLTDEIREGSRNIFPYGCPDLETKYIDTELAYYIGLGYDGQFPDDFLDDGGTDTVKVYDCFASDLSGDESELSALAVRCIRDYGLGMLSITFWIRRPSERTCHSFVFGFGPWF